MKFKKYEQGQIRAGAAVRGQDVSVHTHNTKQLHERPRMVYMGPPAIAAPSDANELWPPHYYQRWPFHDGIAADQNLFTDSLVVHRDSAYLRIHVCVIGSHLIELYTAADFEDLVANRSSAIVTMKARFRQNGGGSSNWDSLAADITETKDAQIRFWPTDRSGISRFLLQQRQSAYVSSKGGSDGYRFPFREGQLWPEDYALVQWITIETQLDDNFDTGRPIRFDLDTTILSADVTWGTNEGTTSTDLLRLSAISSSIYAWGS